MAKARETPTQPPVNLHIWTERALADDGFIRDWIRTMVSRIYVDKYAVEPDGDWGLKREGDVVTITGHRRLITALKQNRRIVQGELRYLLSSNEVQLKLADSTSE